MERLNERLALATRTLATFREVLSQPKSAAIRDAGLKWFEYTFEIVLRAAQLYLKQSHGTEQASPKMVMQGCVEVGLLEEGKLQLALAMADDRDLAVGGYSESSAEEVFGRLPAYATLLEDWLQGMSEKSRT